MKPVASFFVSGVPRPKGSTRSFRHNRTGKIITWADNAERLRPWQRAIAVAARAAGLKPASGSVDLVVRFYLPRPKRHYGARGLRPSAPDAHTQKPDLDKLLRAVLDALTGVAYRDDGQVLLIEAMKLWADEEAEGRGPGVLIRVWQDGEGDGDGERKERGVGLAK